jgi:hypothetical protein
VCVWDYQCRFICKDVLEAKEVEKEEKEDNNKKDRDYLSEKHKKITRKGKE